MRIEVLGNNVQISDALRSYAESRVGAALRRAASRLSWVGVRFLHEGDRACNARVACQLDVWMRGLGLVTVRHIDTNPYVAVDCAAVRLEQALVRRLREAGQVPTRPEQSRSRASRPAKRDPRYAVVVAPADARPRLSLIPWLRARYGVEQLHTLSLAWPEWDALVAGEVESPQLERFKDRFALAGLGQPQAVIVVGGAVPKPSWNEPPQTRTEVQRIVKTLGALDLPVDVLGVWVDEHWTADDCLIESEELTPPASRAARHHEDEELYAGLTSD